MKTKKFIYVFIMCLLYLVSIYVYGKIFIVSKNSDLVRILDDPSFLNIMVLQKLVILFIFGTFFLYLYYWIERKYSPKEVRKLLLLGVSIAIAPWVWDMFSYLNRTNLTMERILFSVFFSKIPVIIASTFFALFITSLYYLIKKRIKRDYYPLINFLFIILIVGYLVASTFYLLLVASARGFG